MHILITNDDGVFAPGLLALCHELRGLGEVSIVAPDRNWSASGHVKTLDRPLRVKEVELADGTAAVTTDGAPSDCVALALLGLIPDEINLVVSGINPNANIGRDITYSGTVTAAMEAVIRGVPGLAISLDSPGDHSGGLDYGPAARTTRKIVKKIMLEGLDKIDLLNINIPYLSDDQLDNFLITRQGNRVFREWLVHREDPRGKSYYWIGGDSPTSKVEVNTDAGALVQGIVSITPLQLDLTDHDQMDQLENWTWLSEA